VGQPVRALSRGLLHRWLCVFLWGLSRFRGRPLICSDERCTGNHNRNIWANICPRIRDAGVARDRERYAEQTWIEHHAKQLKTRRLKALQRMRRRASEQV
jgi:hypothetical protein